MELRSPSVGKVVRVSVEPGAEVTRGQEVLVIESMKVEIPIKAPATGRVTEFKIKVGDQVQRNTVLALIQT